MGLAPDQGDAQRVHRRAQPRRRAAARGPPAGDAAGDGGSSRGGRRLQGTTFPPLRRPVMPAKETHMTARASDASVRGSAMRAGGYWLDRTIDEYLVQDIAKHPDKLAVVGYRDGRDGSRRITYGELGDMVARAAGALRGLGVEAGDVVAAQLPNWWEFVVLAFACGRLGAVFNPMMPIFREREMSYMLAFAEVKLLVVPKTFRGFDHEEMAARLQGRAAAVEARHRRRRRGDQRVRAGPPAWRHARRPAEVARRLAARAGRSVLHDVHLGDDRLAQGGDAHLEHLRRLHDGAGPSLRPRHRRGAAGLLAGRAQ